MSRVEAETSTQFVTAGSLLYSVEHRPWLPPDGPWLFSQRWNDVLFAHFPVDPPTLRKLVPAEMNLDLYDGCAWLTISPGSVSHLRPRGVPPLPSFSSFPRLIVRTYVTMNDKPGVYFLSADAAHLSAVWLARLWFRMEFWHAAIRMGGATVNVHRPADHAIHFFSRRIHGPAGITSPASLDVSYLPEGASEYARSHSLDAFLIERFCVYTRDRRNCYRIEIHRQPWPLQQVSVEFRGNSMAAPFGLELPSQPALCHFSRSQKMLLWAPERVDLR
jgi:hypothetical protein